MKPNDENRDKLLIDYALGELDTEETTRVELMLAENPELMREARALKRMVSRMGVSMIMPPPKLVSRTRHAAYEARAKRRGWHSILPAALRRPAIAAVAVLAAAVLVVAFVGPSMWPPPEPATPIRAAGTMPQELRPFLESNLGHMRALANGEFPDIGDFSVPVGQAMLLQEKPLTDDEQLALLKDIETVWRLARDRADPTGQLSAKTIEELADLVAEKRLLERTEELLGH